MGRRGKAGRRKVGGKKGGLDGLFNSSTPYIKRLPHEPHISQHDSRSFLDFPTAYREPWVCRHR